MQKPQLLLPLLLILLAWNCQAQSTPRFNLDFEDYKSEKQLAEGWFKWGSYPLSMDTIAHTGTYAGKVSSGANGGSFGCIVYQIQGTYPADLDSAFDSGSNIEFPALDEELIDNLVLLGQVWGFLKYHHPEVGKGKYNWDYDLFRMLPAYLEANEKSDRNQVLLDWIAQYGEVPKCKKCKKTSKKALLKPDHSWMKAPGISPQLTLSLKEISFGKK